MLTLTTTLSDIQDLEQLLAQGEAEYVELQALFESARTSIIAVKPALQRLNSATMSALAAEAEDATKAPDLSLLTVTQRIEKLNTLRRKAYDLRASDADDNLVDSTATATTATTAALLKGRAGELLTKQEKEKAEKRLKLLQYIAADVTQLECSIENELDRRIGLVVENTNLRSAFEDTHSAAGAMKTVNAKPLGKLFSQGKQLYASVGVKGLLNVKQMVRSAKSSLRLPLSVTSVVGDGNESNDTGNRDESADASANDGGFADERFDMALLWAEMGSSLGLQQSSPTSNINPEVNVNANIPSSAYLVPSELPSKSEGNAVVDNLTTPTISSPIVAAEYQLSSQELNRLRSAVAISFPHTSPTIFIAQMIDIFDSSDYRKPLEAKTYENDPFQGPLVDSFLRASQEWPPKAVRRSTNFSGMNNAEVTTDGLNSNGDTPEEDLQHRKVHELKTAAQILIQDIASVLNIVVKKDIGDNSVSTMLGVNMKSFRKGRGRGAGRENTEPTTNRRSSSPPQRTAEQNMHMLYGKQKAFRAQARHIQYQDKQLRKSQDDLQAAARERNGGDIGAMEERELVSHTPPSMLRACVAASLGSIINKLEDAGVVTYVAATTVDAVTGGDGGDSGDGNSGAKTVATTTATNNTTTDDVISKNQREAREYVRQVDRYFRMKLHKDQDVEIESPRPTVPAHAHTTTHQPTNNHFSAAATGAHNKDKNTEKERVMLAKADKVVEADKAKKRAQNRLFRAEYRAWIAERQLLIFLSYLPFEQSSVSVSVEEASARNKLLYSRTLLVLERYSVLVLICAAWCVLGSSTSNHERVRPCTSRELLMWLSKEMELTPHAVDNCACCSQIIAIHKDGIKASLRR